MGSLTFGGIHAEMLRAYLRRDFETIMFSGDPSSRQHAFALQKIKSGRFRILVATGQILDEGADIADLEALFLAFPVSFHGKLAQYIDGALYIFEELLCRDFGSDTASQEIERPENRA